MTDYRSAAEIFVTAFLDYMYKEDILDEFDKKTQKMVRSAGVQKLLDDAEAIFSPRAGKAETDKLTPEQITEAVEASPNVINLQNVFARKIQQNGGARELLARVLVGDPEAIILGKELIAANEGEKNFDVP